MVLKKLEGNILQSYKDLNLYKEYLDSYRTIFKFKTFEYLNTPIKNYIYKGVIPSKNKLTLLEAYTNYLVVGKLNKLSKLYIHIDVPENGNNRKLIELFKEKNYDIENLIKNLINIFIDSYLEKIKYLLNQNKLVEITNFYNTTTYKRSKL